MKPLNFALILVIVFVIAPATAALSANCKDVPLRLTYCLRYSQGDADQPAADCCPAARNQSDFCLCDLVRIAYNGEKLMGSSLLYDRVVNLGKICNLNSSNISLCPATLGLQPGSPDYAAFNGTAPPPKSSGVANKVRYSYTVASAILSAVLYSALSF